MSEPAFYSIQLKLMVRRVEESVSEDVALLKASPFIKPGTRIIGFKYDIMTGVAEKLEESEVGK